MPRLGRRGYIITLILLVVVLITASVAVIATRPRETQARAQGMGLARFGAPVQKGVSGPDSATSFNATLPNGRRVTPLGLNVQVGENPLNAALTPDGQYLVVSNDDERNTGAINTKYSDAQQNGAGKVPGGFTLAVVRTTDMQIVTSVVAPKNTKPNPGPKAPGVTQSDATSAFFLGVAIKANPATPGSFTVYASGGPSDLVDVYTLGADGTLTASTTINVPVPTDPTKPNYGMASPGGLTLTPDGSKLFVVNNNADTVVTIDTATNTVVGAPVAVGFFPYAGVLSPDGKKLYVSNWGVASRSFNSTYTTTGSGSPNLGGQPGNAFQNPQTSAASTSSISVVDLSGAAPTGSVSLARPIDGVNIVGGTHPSAMTLVTHEGKSVLYVADANEDRLALIDTANDTLAKKVLLRSPIPGLNNGEGEGENQEQRVLGLTPNALAVSPDNTRLYIAEAGLNAIAVYDVSHPLDPTFLGRIPAGWYPTGVTVSADGKSLYIINAKGFGSDYKFQGAVPGSPDVNLLFGTAQKVTLAGLDLAKTTDTVSANTFRTIAADDNTSWNKTASQIQHVIYILRENKTYDTYFGADATLNARGANGNAANSQFGAIVPNTKALAEQFAIGDNAYADAEESDAGHSFALAGTSTDYQQKTLLSRFNRPFINTKNEDPEDYPLLGYIFNNAARQQVSYRDYGDNLRVSGYDDGKNPNPCADDPYPGCDPATYSYKNTTAPTNGLGGLYSEDVPSLAALKDHVDANYPGWNLRISDQRRAKEFIQDYQKLIDAGQAPRFTFIWLPDDHTGGGLDPRFEVADNDAALGQIVDFVSHSAIWPHTAMFITEDDGQGSPDHVSAHRSYTMVVSPYAKHQQVVHTLSSTVSIPKTIEELLNLPAMNLGDLLANDLSDYFTATPDLTPYSTKAQAAVAEAQPESQRIAALSAKLDYSSYDRDNARLGQIDTLFMRSVALAQQQPQMAAPDYQAAQDALYTSALGVVGQTAATTGAGDN